MTLKIGIDVGGTFTDFLVTRKGEDPGIYKVLSTPEDPSLGVIAGLEEIARNRSLSLTELAAAIETIVHGTTVTTNAALTMNGAKTGLLTTRGVRDALEMRRGIREERYNNRFTNVPPLVARHLRAPIAGRLDYRGEEIDPLNPSDISEAIRLFREESVTAVAICFMNSFANAQHEKRAEEIVRSEMPDAYVTRSSDLLPSIRFYDRVSTTVLNSYVGPKLGSYLDNLTRRLGEIGFGGLLLIMQSNGGVVSPETARDHAALTLLSGPAAGPGAGLEYARIHDRDSCITVDMGGTSFDAALVRNGTPWSSPMARSTVTASLFPCSASTRSGQEEEASGGSMKGDSSGWGRRAPGPIPDRPAMEKEEPSPQAPMRISSWDTSTRNSSRVENSTSIGTRRKRRSGRKSPIRSDSPLPMRPPGCTASSIPTWRRAYGKSRSSADTTRANSRWSSPVVPGPCTVA